jgi:hypothetical protein
MTKSTFIRSQAYTADLVLPRSQAYTADLVIPLFTNVRPFRLQSGLDTDQNE